VLEAFVILFLVIVIICWACYRRKLDKAAYGIASLDIALRIFAFIAAHIGKNDVATFLGKCPDSILAVADKYLDGFIYSLVAWMFVILMLYFLFLTIRIFFKK
jgi:hypothetical protein